MLSADRAKNKILNFLRKTLIRKVPGDLAEIGCNVGESSVVLRAVIKAYKGGLTTTDMGYKSPGVKKACDDFFADKPEQIIVLFAGIYTSGYFFKN